MGSLGETSSHGLALLTCSFWTRQPLLDFHIPTRVAIELWVRPCLLACLAWIADSTCTSMQSTAAQAQSQAVSMSAVGFRP